MIKKTPFRRTSRFTGSPDRPVPLSSFPLLGGARGGFLISVLLLFLAFIPCTGFADAQYMKWTLIPVTNYPGVPYAAALAELQSALPGRGARWGVQGSTLATNVSGYQTPTTWEIGSSYTIEFTAQSNYYRMLSSNFVMTAAISYTNWYMPYSNTLSITASGLTAPAAWTLSGPSEFNNSLAYRAAGTNSMDIVAVPTGTYSVTFLPVVGYHSPGTITSEITATNPIVNTIAGTYSLSSNSLTVRFQPPATQPTAKYWVDNVAFPTLLGPFGHNILASLAVSNDYTVTFGAVRGYQFAASTTLTNFVDARILTNTFIPYSNSLAVAVVGNTSGSNCVWTLAGPDEFTNAVSYGTTFTNSFTVSGIPTGLYTVTFPAIIGYSAPAAAATNITGDSPLINSMTGTYASVIWGTNTSTNTPATNFPASTNAITLMVDTNGLFKTPSREKIIEANGLLTIDGTNLATGPQGPAGSNGAAGAQGPQGIQGPQGPPGSNGINGATGPQGPAGTNGTTGAQGPQGIQGPQGPAGSNGIDGAVGPQGPPGTNGATGAQGPQGVPGSNGVDGAVGPQGPAGTNGADGATGPQGPAGSNGVDGAVGPQGPAGPVTNRIVTYLGITYTITNDPTASGDVLKFDPTSSNAWFAAVGGAVGDLSSTQIVTRIVSFSGVDFDSLVGTNSPDDLYQFSLTIATNPAFTGTTVSFQSTNNPAAWFYWNGAQFEDMEYGELPHLYLNSYQARVFYAWTNSIRGDTYYCRGYIINSDLLSVINIVNKVLEPK